MLFLCQYGFESVLARELRANKLSVLESGPGWGLVRSSSKVALGELCFPNLVLLNPSAFSADSVNALAHQILSLFLESMGAEAIENIWLCVFASARQIAGLGRRATSVENAFRELLKKKLARIARMARSELPPGVGFSRGLVVYFADFKRVFVSREVWRGGQCRMADDAQAPSRSYLKIEEAYAVFGREPIARERVCDLGAAPGGWSYSAAKRGAKVVAVDNGPLKGGALDHPYIDHYREDAFKYAPRNQKSFDWMFCDLVEEPRRVLNRLITPWLSRGWCRRFIVNLKFGHTDPLMLLREVRAKDSPFALYASNLCIRHLYHDREEFTVMGESRLQHPNTRHSK